jgi:NDP-sugar pyrophosphorylase family protein
MIPHQALVLTAGFGKRLRPLSAIRAKPAVPVAGEPLVHRLLRWLVGQGVQDAVLNLHYLPNTITGVVGDGSGLGIRIRYTWEPRLLGSAGGPRAMLPLLDPGSTFILNGDTLTDMSLERLAAEHKQSGARVTLAVADNPDPVRYGGVTVDDGGWVREFLPPGHQAPSMHFVGVQLVEPSVFDQLTLGEPASTVGGLYTDLVASEPRGIRAHRISGRFLDISTPADYLKTSLALASESGLSQITGAGSHVDPSARLVRTAIWDRVTVEAHCELTDCVVTDGVQLPSGSRFTQQVLLLQPGSVEPLVAPLIAKPTSSSEGSTGA